MTFGIGYADDIAKAEEVLNRIVQEHDKVLKQPPPMIKLHSLGESSVDFVVRPWVKTEDYWDVYWDITRSVKMRFDEEGISIPFPQRDIHLFADKRIEAGMAGSTQLKMSTDNKSDEAS
jgi:small conductance mechanosensitive channel